MTSKLRIAVLNPTCLDVINHSPATTRYQGAEMLADPSYRTATRAQLNDSIHDCDALILPARARDFPNAMEMQRHQRLRVISIAAVGYDWLDLEAASNRGILVTNAPAREGTEVVADMAFALLLSAARAVPEYHRRSRLGDTTRGVDAMVWGKTLGIIGLGRIGQAVARRAHGFDMRVFAFSTLPDEALAQRCGVEFVDLDGLLTKADFVSLHVPLSDGTQMMIGERELSLMKPTAFLINAARRELVNEEALTRALVHHSIAGAAFDDPPSSITSPLLALPNYISTPHVGNRVHEGMQAVFSMAWHHAIDALHGKVCPDHTLNPHVLRHP